MLKSPVTTQGMEPAIWTMRSRNSFADSMRARPLKASKCVLNQQKVGPPSRGRSFTQVTMCGEMAPHPRLPGFSGVVLSQKCPPSKQFEVGGLEEH